jgi:pyrroline-5-carboxylate reductase
MNRIGIIGCGHMGTAIASAALQKKLGTVFIGTPHKKSIHGARWTKDNIQVVNETKYLIIGVRPGMVEAVLREIKPALTQEHVLISIAAGVHLKKLSKWSGNHKKIVRSIPNLPAQVGKGVSVWMATNGLSKAEKQQVTKFFESFGISMEVKKEKLIDMAVVSGCGPAYVAAFLESMSRFAQKAGFTGEQARQMAIATVLGSVVYMDNANIDFAELKQAVQTKGGVTEAAFKLLKKKKWQQIMEKSFDAACRRMSQLVS